MDDSMERAKVGNGGVNMTDEGDEVSGLTAELVDSLDWDYHLCSLKWRQTKSSLSFLSSK